VEVVYGYLPKKIGLIFKTQTKRTLFFGGGGDDGVIVGSKAFWQKWANARHLMSIG